jgi:archaellum component FlaG (FlaF/FlaG flagellin family)
VETAPRPVSTRADLPFDFLKARGTPKQSIWIRSGFLVVRVQSAIILEVEDFMTRLLITFAILFAVAASSLAQNLGDPITATFNAEDVQTRQGKLALDPTSHTILRFYDEVGFAFSRRSDILKAVPKGNDVVLYAMTEKVETDLSVLVEGKWHFFSVKIAKGSGLRFYEIKKRDPTTAEVNNAVNQPSSPGRTASSNANSSASLVSPNWLKWNLIPIKTSGDEIRLSYTLENTGKDRVAFSEKSLRVLRDGKPLSFTLENNGKQILDPGEVFAGVIRIKASPGILKLQWSVRIMGSQESLVLESDVK